MKNGYYSYERIDETGAHYRMIIGERSNGKTYGALLKIVKNYVDNGKQSAYVRRYREDFVGKRGATLFASLEHDDQISKLTGGEWNCVYYYSGAWYLALREDGGKPQKDEKPFCYGFALNNVEHDKSTSYPDITLIVFDEFLSRSFYLTNEFVIFMNVISTIIRQRDDVVIYMLGNTVSKYAPYFAEMGIDKIKEMEQGQIDIYSYGDSDLKVAVEYAEAIDDSIKASKAYFAFDNPSLNMITKGDWEFDLYPHMKIKYKPKDVKLYYFIEFDGELLQCEIIKNTEGLFTFIHRKTTEIKSKKDILFTTKVDANPYHFRRLTKPTNERTKLILDLLKSEKVFFQDNSVGETLRNYINWCTKTDLFRN